MLHAKFCVLKMQHDTASPSGHIVTMRSPPNKYLKMVIQCKIEAEGLT